MRILLLLLLPISISAQQIVNLKYQLKEVHNITMLPDSNVKWSIDTIKYHVPFEIKFTKTKVSIDGYGNYTITKYEDRSHEGTQIDHWKLSNGSTITRFETLMYWEYPFVKGKAKTIFFKID
jgi:hypothetical protein